MPTYLIEGGYPDGIVLAPRRRRGVRPFVHSAGVRWVRGYITNDGCRVFAICEAPHPEAVRVAAGQRGLPIDRIVRVRAKENF